MMSFDGLMLKAVVGEAARLGGARVNKVYQPGDHEIVLHLWGGAANHKLLISAHPQHARLHLTNLSFENPPTPPAFCMLLRKHLEGARLLGIEQPGWERVAHLRFSGIDELGLPSERVLIAETMGRSSNIVLLNGEGRILDALRRSGGVDVVRPVLPGLSYAPPPPQEKADPLDPNLADHLTTVIAAAADADKIAAVLQGAVTGFSPMNMREAVFRAGYDPATTVAAIRSADAPAAAGLAAAIGELAGATTAGPSPQWLPLPAGRAAFAPFPLIHLTGEADPLSFPTCWQLLDHVFGERVASDRLEQQRTALNRQLRDLLSRQRRKLSLQEEAVREAEAAESLRLYGELLTAQLHAVTPGADRVRLPNWYDPDGADVEITLDPRLSPAANAQHYFRRFRKAQATLAGAGEQAAKTRTDIAYLEQVEQTLEHATTPDEVADIRAELMAEGYLRHRPVRGERLRGRLAGERSRRGRKGRPAAAAGKGQDQPAPPLRFRSSDGLDIFVGRNNRQNDWLTLRRAAAHDIWLHAKDMPGSHVVLVLPPGIAEPPSRSMEEAAALAAFYSKGREATRVPVDFTEKRHVHKPRGARPGMVIYEHHRTIYAAPDAAIAERLQAATEDAEARRIRPSPAP